MESRLSAKLDGIEQRLALLEASSTHPTPMTSTLSNLTITFYFLVMFKATCKYMAHKYREKFKTFDYLKLEKIATVIYLSLFQLF